MSERVRVRFAPAPTGYLHLGSARTALFNWMAAKAMGGEFLLRIEDTDTERSQQEMIDVILVALSWMGLDWDGPVVRQSEFADAHREAVDGLLAAGKAYWSTPVPPEDRERTGGRGYDPAERDRGLGPGDGRAVRFKVPHEGTTAWSDLIRGDVSFDNENLEDFVIARADGSPTFFLANCIDDHEMGVTHIIRGEDLLNVTPKQMLLRNALGYPGCPTQAHLPLIVNEKRKKLSKRRDDVSLLDYRDRGYLPDAMFNYLALLGWGPPDGVEVRIDARDVFPTMFEVTDINSAPAGFDPKKLLHVNAEHLRALSVPELTELARPYVEQTSWADRFDSARFAQIAPEVQTRVETLAEVPGYVDFLFMEDPEITQADWDKAMVPDAARWLDALITGLGEWPFDAESLHTRTFTLAEELGANRRKFQAPIRVALTGRRVGPPLFESMSILGRDEVLRRLGSAREHLGDHNG
ncbi:MAG: glutamate--tRNA ligase [Microthrixaceae bacterium]